MRFISCGEALIDLVQQPGGDPAATPWLGRSAGGPVNSAIGLARLGLPVDMLARLGSDAFAGQLADYLSGNGVGLGLAPRVDAPTTLAVVAVDPAGHATYAFHFAGTSSFGWTAPELPAPRADTWLHLASIAWVVEPGAAVLRSWLEATAPGWAGVSYDVNVRPTVIADPARYWALVEPLLRAVGGAGGVIKASDEDLLFLARAGGAPAGGVEAIARDWQAHFGAAAVVVTLGADGALAVGPAGTVTRVPGCAVDTVDTVGAGDTFLAGFLQRYTADGDLPGALRRGVAAAALVCARQGADPPTAGEVDALLAAGS
ncbi:MAG: PfkB family carbohydrate kinase [Propionibacteriaceae bacterium]|jgi:fructokinase|nr:PfkB family carbohydrate kinase [Propionibacteriaceae bacterium]